jgi:tetratricopeptide (TPR) repeat protein
MPARGTLAAHPLPRLLLELSEACFQGALVLERERTRKRFVLRDGAPILAESNLASESLGVLLLDQGRITREDHVRVSEQVRKQGCKEGKALLALGLLEPKDLFVALKEQLRRRMLDCFSWPDGVYALEASDEAPAEAQAFRVDPLALVLDGLVLHWTADRLYAALGDRLSLRLAPTAQAPAVVRRLRPDAGAAALLDALDGRRTLAEAVHACGAPGALAAAWTLDASGALAVAPEAALAPPAEAKPAASAAEPEIDIVFDGDEDAASEARVKRAAGASADTADGSDDAVALRAELLDRHARLDALDHYTLLGIARNADAAAVKRAYFQAAKRYHPDALTRLGLADLRAAAGEIFARIAKAHAVLVDPAERRAYDAAGDDAAAEDAQRLASAETFFRKGDILLRKGAFRDALQFLGPAVELWPEDSAYRCALGWALYKQAKSDPAAARDHLRAAVELDGRSAVAHYRLGVVLRSLGERDAAEAALARAKALDPKASAG